MVPLKNFRDLLAKLGQIKEKFNPPFYVISLYKEENTEFRNYILSNFSNIHSYTGNVMFALVENPPREWINREDTGYFHDIMGENYNPELNDYEVEVICGYLRINPKNLPCVILFSDIERKDFNWFSFKNAEKSTIERFFQHLLDSAGKFSYQSMDYIDLMFEIRDNFPELKTGIEYTHPSSLKLMETFSEIAKVFMENDQESQEEINGPSEDIRYKKRRIGLI
jgi:hypothetical protein